MNIGMKMTLNINTIISMDTDILCLNMIYLYLCMIIIASVSDHMNISTNLSIIFDWIYFEYKYSMSIMNYGYMWIRKLIWFETSIRYMWVLFISEYKCEYGHEYEYE